MNAGGGFVSRFEELVWQRPGAAALICGATGLVTTRAALLDRASEIRGLLEGEGIRAGSAIAVQLPNSPDFVASFLAALQLGVTFVPIDRDARQSEVAAVLQHFGLEALLYNPGPTEGSLPAIITRPGQPAAALCQAALLKLTSGSTGRPKGILTTERNLVADCLSICATMGITAEDRNLGAIPFSHSYGFSNLVTPLLLQGTAIVYSNEYLPLSLLELSNRHHVTVLPGIPLVFEHLSKLPPIDGTFATVRTFISAGAPLAATTSRRFRDRFGTPIHTFYGCSECGGISYDRLGGAVERGSVGAPLEGVTLRIDADMDRLVVESASVAIGYFDPVQESCDKFTPGRFLTDDIVETTADGELRIVGRVNELMNVAGKKVNPREIEATILQIDGVQEVRVFGEPAGARGDVVAAAIVATPEVSREQIRAHCRSHLSAHKVPRIIKLIDALPVDERGKVKRSALAAL
jgi:acyl-CoA synthetase (AMP-forming)/AMP-acid ligase II